jgi:hypothetical protein
MRQRGVSPDDAQVHVLEMLTLFWLFFMSGTFILQLQIPDPVSPAADGALQLGAEDAFVLQLGTDATDSANHTTKLGEMLATETLDDSCNALLAGLPSFAQGNCWLAKNGGELTRHGGGSTPLGRTVSIHHLVHDGGDVWTVSLQVWNTGGGV